VIPSVILFLIISTPYVDEDSLVYHYAFPWQCLQIHGIPLSNVTFLFHLPLPIDLAFALPLILGDDRLAKCIIAGAFAALSAFVAGRCLARREFVVVWLTPLIAFASSYNSMIAFVPKNDAVAIGCFVVGAILWRDGLRSTGALFFGGAVVTKLTCGPFVVAWLLMHPPRLRRTPIQLSLLIIPALPWLIKTWLATGSPVFPAFWKWMPSPFWGPDNQKALENFGMWVPGAGNIRTLIPALAKVMWNEFTLYLIALPVILYYGRWRAGVALILGFAGALGNGGLGRYLVPGIWLESYEIASVVGKVPKRIVWWIHACLIPICLFQMLHSSQGQLFCWRDFLRPAAIRREQYLTTYAKVVHELKTTTSSRIMIAGGWRSYLLPGRVLFNGFWGESPVIWKLVRTSSTEEQLRRRFRQLGFNVMLYNLISGDLVSGMTRTFVWTDPMLRIYSEFCRHRLSVLRYPEYIDGENGGFYLLTYDLSPRGGQMRPPYFLPTAETAIYSGRMLTLRNRFVEAKTQIEDVLNLTGGVGFFVSQLAEVYAKSGNWQIVYSLLSPFAKAGLIDSYNLPRLGEAAANIGKYDEAITILRRCLTLYSSVIPNRINLAWTFMKRAQYRMRMKKDNDARIDLDCADEAITMVSPAPGEYYELTRRQVYAEILGTRADILFRNGNIPAARDLYRKAIDLAPELPEVKDWRHRSSS
jgi:hypothetical protein